MLKKVSAVALFAVALNAQAGVYKCQDENGKLSFSDKPCPSDESLVEHRMSEQEKARIRAEERRKAVEAERRAKAEQYKAEQAELERQKQALQQEALIQEAEAIQRELSKWSHAADTAKVANSGWDGYVYQVEMYLEKVLKDPDSFEAIEWGPVWTKSGQEYRVRCQYRVKNSFGGYVIADQVFFMNSQGKVFNSVEYTGKHIALH